MPYKSGTWGDKAKARSQKRKEYFKEYSKKRRQTHKAKNTSRTKPSPEVRAKYRREYKLRNPEKWLARELVRRAINSGELVRQPCEKCGEEKVHAHHDDYSDPLKVRWLCITHHWEYHNSERK